MYFYCYSGGEYERYMETIYYHHNQYSDEEFEKMVKETKTDEKLCEKYGFKVVELQAHYHED